MRVETVTWRDAHFDPDQLAENEWRDEYLVTTIGFVVRDNEKWLSIAQEKLPEDDGYRAVTHIPQGMVISREALVRRNDGAGMV